MNFWIQEWVEVRSITCIRFKNRTIARYEVYDSFALIIEDPGNKIYMGHLIPSKIFYN
jgi:hypothetical protein